MFGRLSRGPKLPNKPAESDSSSESDDGSEDSSSLEDAEEMEMDSKDLCVEIKAKEKDKAKATERLHTPLSGRSPSPCGRDESPVQLGDLLQDAVGARRNDNGAQRDDKKPSAPENSWMKWDDDRTTRANQDCQRELESTAVRELVKYFGKRKVRFLKHLKNLMFEFHTIFSLPPLSPRLYLPPPDHLPTTTGCSTTISAAIRS